MRIFRVRTLFYLVLLWMTAWTPAILNAQTPALTVDLGVPDGCLSCDTLFDRVSQKSIRSGDTFQGNVFQFTIQQGAFSPAQGSALAFSAPSVTPGFSVVAQLAPFAAGAGAENVLTLKDAAGTALFGILRDSHGRWFVGKKRDGGTERYVVKVWDPVSPCVMHTCSSDTLYASFLANGQIVLDEIATITDGGPRYDWESGLLNYGLPVSAYRQSNVAPNAPWTPDPGPTQKPQFVSPSKLVVEGLGTNFWPVDKDYPILPARLARFAVYAGAPLVLPQSPNTVGTTAALVLADHNNRAGMSAIGGTIPLDWLPCSSGRYEQPKFDPNSSKQYWPSQLNTPCNAPSVPLGLSQHFLPGSGSGGVNLDWQIPTYPGTPPEPGGQASVYDYVLTVDGPNISNQQFVTSTPNYFIDNLSAGTYNISVAARNQWANGKFNVGPAARVTVKTGPPSQPKNLQVMPANGSLRITWDASQAQGGGGSITYTVTVIGVPNGQPVVTGGTTTSTSYIASGLANGYTYTAIVTPSNSFGNGSPVSGTGIPTSAAPPQAPYSPAFTICATRGHMCTIPSLSVVGYGGTESPGNLYYVTTSKSVLCDDSSFGGKPSTTSGTIACWYAPAPPYLSENDTFCAVVGGTCHLAGAGTIHLYSVFNINGNIVATSTGDKSDGDSVSDYPCSNSYATTPVCTYDRVKARPLDFTYCSWNGNICNGGDILNTVATAARTTQYRSFTKGGYQGGHDFYCLDDAGGGGSPNIFGQQPTMTPNCSLGVHLPAPPSSPYTYCNTENHYCAVPTPRKVAFGKDGYGWVFKAVNDGTPCSLEGFNYDPAPGQWKTCHHTTTYSAPPGPTPVYVQCAGENATCNVFGTTAIAFGVAPNFVFGTSSGSGVSTTYECSLAWFNNLDPAVGQSKNCFVRYIKDLPTGSGWVRCADVDFTCTVPADALVAFGVNGAYYYLNKSATSFQCNASGLGIPSDFHAPHIFGYCYYNTSLANQAAPPGNGSIRCALSEDQLCLTESPNNTTPYLVGFGTGTRFIYRSVLGGVDCNLDAFGRDPAVGQGKFCFVRPKPTPPSVSGAVTYCAVENGTCLLPDDQLHTVFYGKGGSWFSFQIRNSVSCNNATFGDPYSGSSKDCWYQ